MSDEEYDYDYGSDAEYDYGSDADNNGGNDGEDELIEIENCFYEGEDLIKENPEGAVELFNKVIQLETAHEVIKW
jgi:hypothetical protein